MFPYFISSLRSPCYRPPSRPGHDFSLFLQIWVFSNHCMITFNDWGGDAKVLECWEFSDNKEFPLDQSPAIHFHSLASFSSMWPFQPTYHQCKWRVSCRMGLNWVKTGFTKRLLLKNVCISQIAVFHISCEMLFVRYDKVTIMLLHGNGRHPNYTLLLAPSII